MKKILTSSLFIVAMAAFTGCLKDKGFEDQNYGLQVQNTKAVTFPQSKNSPISFAVNAQTTPQVLRAPVVTLESDAAEASDVVVTVESNPALVAAFPDLTLLPSTEYSLNNTLTIAAGKRLDTMSITIPNSTTLDPNLTYAIGLTIISANNSYIVASNSRDIVVKFSVKNAYDGVYSITGTALRVVGGAIDPALTGPFGPYQREFVTSGANSVQHTGQVNWANGSNSALPAGFEPNITIDPVTLLVTSLTSSNSGISNVTGTGYPQYYDPATRTIYYEMTWGAGPTQRLMTFQSKWLRAR
jgi:hypothetical protein